MAEIYHHATVAGELIVLTPEQMAEVVAKIRDYGQTKPPSSEVG